MLITNANQITQYYKALVDRDASYVGIFYVGVKTTSVFCIATCRARKPKFENVEFYTTYENALEEGYRPCKICRPTGQMLMKLGKAFGVAVAILFSLKVLEFVLKTSQTG